MGRLDKKGKEKGGKKRGIFGRRKPEIDRAQGHEDIQETYTAIGRVNPRRLQGGQVWDIGYLGCVPDLQGWECPSTRSDFMNLVDSGQQRGHLMWCSLTPKRLHISPHWVTITDYRKKLMYAEVPVGSLGSLSYAEDDGKHILGLKAVQPTAVGGAALGTATPTPSEVGDGHGALYCCYVIECANEEMVRQICSAVNDCFQHLLAEQEARRLQLLQQQQQQSQAVKPIMLKRLSTPAAPQPQAAAGKKERKKKVSKQKQSPKDEQFPSPAHESVSEFEFSDLSGSHPEVFVDWSTHGQISPPPLSLSQEQNVSPEREEILQEIGRQFSAITKEPSRRRGIGGGGGGGGGGVRGRGPNVKRLSATGLQGSASRRRREQFGPPADSMESIDDLVPPLQLNVVKQHSGNRVTQELGNTDNIELSDDFDVLVPRGKSRSSVLDQDSFRRLDTVEPMEASQPMNSTFKEEQQPNPEEGSPEDNILHTSLLLETMEEGEVETRIDGDESGTVLIQTHMSEKETAIVGEDGHAALLPASELEEYKNGEGESSAGAPESPGVPPPPPIEGQAPPASGEASPTTEATPPPPPPPPPPEPVKQERKPWPYDRLVGVDKEPWDPSHKEFLDKVASEVGEIIYRQLRQDWLQYQMCKIDVVSFCKKVKLTFRGSKVHLRPGARVLVDEEDRKDFDDVLAGKIIESKGSVAMDTGVAPPSFKSAPSKLVSPSFSPGPSSTSRPPPPAGSGSLGNRLKMFEQPSSNDSEPSYSGGGGGARPGKLGAASRFMSEDNQSSDPPAVRSKPPRSGLLSKIAMFEGGGSSLPTIDEEERTSPKPAKKRQDDKRGREEEEEWEGGRGRDRDRFGQIRVVESRNDSDDDRRDKRRHRSPESRRSSKEKERGGKRKDKHKSRHNEDSEEDRRSKRRKDRGKGDKDYSDDDRKRKDRKKRDDSDTDHKKRRRDDSEDDKKSRKKKDGGRRRDDSSDDDRRSKKHKDRGKKDREIEGKKPQKLSKQESEDTTGLHSILSAGSKLLSLDTKEEEMEEEIERDAIGELAVMLGRQQKDDDSSRKRSPLSKSNKKSPSSAAQKGPSKSPQTSKEGQQSTASPTSQQPQVRSDFQQQQYLASVQHQHHQAAAASHDLQLQHQLQQQQQQQQLASLQQQQQAYYLQQQQQQQMAAMQQQQQYQYQYQQQQQPGMEWGQGYQAQQQQAPPQQSYYQQAYPQQAYQQGQGQYYQTQQQQAAYPVQQQQAQQNPPPAIYQTPSMAQHHGLATQPGQRGAVTNVVPANPQVSVAPVVSSTAPVSTSFSGTAPATIPPGQAQVQAPPSTSTPSAPTTQPSRTSTPPPPPPATTSELSRPEQLTPVTQSAHIEEATDGGTAEQPPAAPPQPDFDETAEDGEEVEMTRFSEESDIDGQQDSTQAAATEETPPTPAEAPPTSENSTSAVPPTSSSAIPPPPPPPLIENEQATNAAPRPSTDTDTQANGESSGPPQLPPVDYKKQGHPPLPPVDYRLASGAPPPLPPVDYDRSVPPEPLPKDYGPQSPPPPPPPPAPPISTNEQVSGAPPPPFESSGHAPPPPPPAPPIGGTQPKKSAEPRKSIAEVHEERDGFLDEIRKGKQLKSIKDQPKQERKPSTSSMHEDLVSEIQSGKKLRKVSQEEINIHSKSVVRRKASDFMVQDAMRGDFKGDLSASLSSHEGLMAELQSGKKLRKVSAEEVNLHSKEVEQKKGVLQLDEADLRKHSGHRDEREKRREKHREDSRSEEHEREERSHGKKHRRRGEEEEREEEGGRKSRRHRHDHEDDRDREERHHRRKHSDEEDRGKDRHSKKHQRLKRQYSQDEDSDSKDRHHKRRDSDEEGGGRRSKGHRHRRQDYSDDDDNDSRDRHHRREDKKRDRHHRDDRDRHDRRRDHRDEEEREEERGRRREREPSRRHHKDTDHDSGKDSPPPSSSARGRGEPKRERERRAPQSSSSQSGGVAQAKDGEEGGGGKKIPAWKADLLKRRQEKDVVNPEKVLDILEGDLGEDSSIPAWKRAMMKKKKSKEDALQQDRVRQQAEFDAKFQGLPDWKKEMMLKKKAKNEAAQAMEMEKQRAEQDKIDMVRAMPEWRRKLFLQKNPDFKLD